MKKMKFCLFLFIQFAMVIHGLAQNPIAADWLINSTTNEWSVVSDQATDVDGNVFLTGYYNTDMALGNSSERLLSGQSVFVARVNAKGDVKWMKKISATRLCYSNSIIAGSNGTLFIAGNYLGEINENGVSLTSPRTKNAFIIKLDAKGKILWGNSINGSFRNKHVFISQDNEGNLIFAGSLQGELTLDNNHYDSRYYCDTAIARLDQKTGKIIASQIMEGSFDDLVNDLIISPKDEIILTGSFEGDLIAGDKSLVSNGQKDVFVAVMDENLRFSSVVQMGGYYDDYGKSLAFDNKGNLLLAGSFAGSLQAGTNEILNSIGKLDVFLIKFDLAGEPVWSKSFGGGANDYVNTLDINGLDEIYVTGSYRGMIETEGRKIKSEEFSTDIFLVKFGENGEFRFSESYGSDHDDFARALCLDNSNSIYVSGNYSDHVEVLGEKSEYSSGKSLFLAKLHDCSSATPVRLPNDTTVCGEEFVLSVDDNWEHYYWDGLPGNNEFVVNSTGWYTLEAIDKHGCITGDTIFVQLNKPQEIDLGGPYLVMKGESLILNTPELPNTKLCIENKIDNSKKELEIVIYPNPSEGRINIAFTVIDNTDQIQIQLISQKGDILLKEVHNSKNTSGRIAVEINTIPSGTYFLQIVSGLEIIYRKIVIL